VRHRNTGNRQMSGNPDLDFESTSITNTVVV
jgi:hypothetical protein